MKKRSIQFMFASILLTNAACHAETLDREASTSSAYPGYGRAVVLKGHYVQGEETSAFYRCDAGREQCAAIPSFGERSCWVRFTKDLHSQVSEKISSQGPEGGSFLLEGIGRISTQRGSFGHLGAYSCQIEFSRIDTLDAYPAAQIDD